MALVLTAGLGTRLAPLTSVLAKPAVPLAGQTLIERLLRWLRSQDVTSAVLNLHHKPETITGIVGDGAHLGIAVRYSWEDPILGSAGGPRHALPLIESDPFLIVNGDTLSNVDLRQMRAAFERLEADVLMALVPNPAPEHYSGVRLDEGRRVAGFVRKGAGAMGSWHFIGVQLARQSVFASLPDGVAEDSVGGIYRTMIAQGGRIFGWPVETPFLDVGTPRDYLEAAIALATVERTSLVDPGAVVDPAAVLERTIVWPGARIEGKARLTECIVASGTVISAGTRAARRIFMPDRSLPVD